MGETTNAPDRMRSVLVIVATIAMVAFNSLSATGYINGITPAVISDKYPTLLTPAGYAFSIWSLIYVGLIGFSIYQARPANLVRFRPLRSLYIFSCTLNCIWIYFWHREQIAVCLGVILILCGTLVFIRSRLYGLGSTGDIWLVILPFGIYLGWVTAASTVNLMVLLTYLKAVPSAGGERLVAITLIAIATAAALIARLTLKDYLAPLAVAWAFTAIAIKQSGNTSIVVATAVGVVITVITSGSIVIDLKDSTGE
jgi:translocator protein